MDINKNTLLMPSDCRMQQLHSLESLRTYQMQNLKKAGKGQRNSKLHVKKYMVNMVTSMAPVMFSYKVGLRLKYEMLSCFSLISAISFSPFVTWFMTKVLSRENILSPKCAQISMSISLKQPKTKLPLTLNYHTVSNDDSS